MPLDPLIALALRLGLAGLMIVSGIHKLRNPDSFRRALLGYRLLPETTVGLSATLIPLVELGLGTAALLPVVDLAHAAIGGIGMLLILYAMAISINLMRGRRDIDCGCMGFGGRREAIGWPMVGRNLLLAIFALAIAVLPLGVRPLLWIDFLGVAFACAAFAFLFIAFDLALALPRQKELL